MRYKITAMRNHKSSFFQTPSPDTYNSLIVIDADGRVYKSESLIVYSASQPIIDLKYTSPSSPKTTR